MAISPSLSHGDNFLLGLRDKEIIHGEEIQTGGEEVIALD